MSSPNVLTSPGVAPSRAPNHLRRAVENITKLPNKAAEIINIASKGISSRNTPNEAREALSLIKQLPKIEHQKKVDGVKGTNIESQLQKQFDKRVTELIKGKTPEEKALGYDFTIAGLQMKLEQVNNELQQLDKLLDPNSGISPQERLQRMNEKKQQLETRDGIKDASGNFINGKEPLQTQITNLQNERNTTIGDKTTIPNQLEQFAKAIGISDIDAETNPLSFVMHKVGVVTNNRNPGSNDVKEIYDKIKDPHMRRQFDELIQLQKEGKTSTEKLVERGRKIGIFGLLMALAMAYLGKKVSEKDKAGGGQGAYVQ